LEKGTRVVLAGIRPEKRPEVVPEAVPEVVPEAVPEVVPEAVPEVDPRAPSAATKELIVVPCAATSPDSFETSPFRELTVAVAAAIAMLTVDLSESNSFVRASI
jgi:hypothetical protein